MSITLYNRKPLTPYTQATAEQVNAETAKIKAAFDAAQAQIESIVAGTPIASYTWTAWADSADGTDNFSNVEAGNRAFIGLAFGKTTPTRSPYPEDYAWTRIKGADGTDGNDGVDGVDGADGKWVEFVWKRAASQPATPTGNGIPSGWSDEPPLGSDPLWMSKAKQELDGTLLTSWSTPVRHDGPPGAAGAAGAAGLNGYSQATVTIYQRAAVAPAVPSVTTTYTFATGVLTGLNNGWSMTIPTGTDPIWATSASAVSQSGSDTIAASEWASPIQLAANGAAGISTATVLLFQRTSSPTPPAAPNANVGYTFSTGVATGLTNGWQQSLPTSGGGYRWMTTATALSTGLTDTIPPAEWASVAMLGQDGADGVNGADGRNVSTVFIYQRATSAPALPSATATYDFATGNLTGLNNGWTTTIPGGSNPIYVSAATANSLTSTDTIGAGEWTSPVILAANGTSGSNGSNGVNAATVYLFQRTTTSSAPAAPSSTVLYNFTTGAISGQNNGWSSALPTSGGAFRWMILATALSTTTTDSIGSGEWAAPALLAQDGANGSDGAQGPAGPTGPTGPTGPQGMPGAAGRDAISFFQDTDPGPPAAANQLWYKPSTKEFFRWNGSSWGVMLGNVAKLDLIAAEHIAVTSLAAITANIGLLRTATTGARTEIENNQIRVYDSAGTLRVRLGVW